MPKLSRFIYCLKVAFGLSVTGNYDENLKIEMIQLFSKEGNTKPIFHKATLYLSEEFVSDIALDEACFLCVNPISNPLLKNQIALEKKMDIYKVLFVLQEELHRFIRMNMKKEEMFQALQKGSGMGAIVEIGSSFLENPIIVCDTSFSIVECSKDHHNTFDFETRNQKQYIKLESIKSMHAEKLVERIFNERHAFGAHRKQFDMDTIYCNIRIHRAVVGYICVLGQNRGFKDIDYDFVEVLAEMLAVEMQKNEFFIGKLGLTYEYFCIDLLEGNFQSHDQLEQRFEQLGCISYPYYWIVALEFKEEEHKKINNRYYIEQLMTIVHNGMALFYRKKLILLFSKKERKAFCEEEQVKLFDFLKFNQMRAALSYSFSDLQETAQYYAQAVQLLELKTLPSEERIYSFEQYGLQALIHKGNTKKEIRAAIHPDLKYLQQYDKENKTEYYHTLECYLKHGRNGTISAEKLHIHRSTFFYRLGKIEELLEIKMTDYDKLFAYTIGLLILDFKEVMRPHD